MKILLDECLPLDFRHDFHGHEAHSAEWAGFKGKGNGDLLRAAELAGYEVFVTVDRGVPHQQNVASGKISIIVIQTDTNRLEDLRPMASQIRKALSGLRPGRIVFVD